MRPEPLTQLTQNPHLDHSAAKTPNLWVFIPHTLHVGRPSLVPHRKVDIGSLTAQRSFCVLLRRRRDRHCQVTVSLHKPTRNNRIAFTASTGTRTHHGSSFNPITFNPKHTPSILTTEPRPFDFVVAFAADCSSFNSMDLLRSLTNAKTKLFVYHPPFPLRKGNPNKSSAEPSIRLHPVTDSVNSEAVLSRDYFQGTRSRRSSRRRG